LREHDELGGRVAEPVWRFYEAPGGGSQVEKDIQAAFGSDVKGRARLAALMMRIARGQTLRRDVTDLKRGLYEGRLTHEGREFRLFFTKRDGGLLLLALHFTRKKSQTIPKEIKLARKRLADAPDGV